MVGKNHILPGGCHHRHFHHSANTPTVSRTPGNAGTYTCRATEWGQVTVLHQHLPRDTHPDVAHHKSVAKTNGNGLRYGTPAKLQYNLPQRRTPSAPRQPTYGHPKNRQRPDATQVPGNGYRELHTGLALYICLPSQHQTYQTGLSFRSERTESMDRPEELR